MGLHQNFVIFKISRFEYYSDTIGKVPCFGAKLFILFLFFYLTRGGNVGYQGRIIGAVENAEPLTTIRRTVNAPSRYVLEGIWSYGGKVRAFDPQRVLERGYALALDSRGQAVKSVSRVRRGDALDLRVADGRIGGPAAHLPEFFLENEAEYHPGGRIHASVGVGSSTTKAMGPSGAPSSGKGSSNMASMPAGERGPYTRRPSRPCMYSTARSTMA